MGLADNHTIVNIGTGAQALFGHLDHGLHQVIKVRAGLAQFIQQVATDLLDVVAGKVGVEVIGSLLQLAGAVGTLGLDNAVLHFLGIKHQNHQHAIIGQRQEFDMAQSRTVPARQHHHTRQTGNARQQIGYGMGQFGAAGGRPVNASAQRGHFLLFQWFQLQQGINEKPVAARSRHPPG